MKKQVWGYVAVIAGVALLVGGVATASNMGFKFVPQIPGASGNNAFNLSLPWNNNLPTLSSVFDDFAGQGQGVSRVTYFTSDQQFLDWTGPGSSQFTLNKGDAVIVFGQNSGQTPVVVGSHDPNFTFTFPAGALNASAPYHQTYTAAPALFDALTAHCGAGVIARVTKFTSDAQFLDWTGPGSSNFGLDLGMGVIVFANSPCSGFVWAHY